MTTVAFIGSGQIGRTVARLAVDAGHQVVLSNSRGPETLADTVAELGPRASAATSGEAAAAGDLVVLSVPLKAFPDLPAAALAGKTVIDTCNYGPERDGPVPVLDEESLTSSELLLRYVPDAVVVKAFNSIFFAHLLSLARPAGAADRSYLPIAGDSASAKAAVAEFIDSIGYGVVDAGPLAEGWRQATRTPVWGTPYGPYSDEHGRPAGEDAIRAALAAATRPDASRDAGPAIPIDGVDFVTLWVDDWAEAKAFYADVLALPLSAEYAWASSSEYEAGALTLQVRLASGDEQALVGKAGTIALHVVDVESGRRALERRGVAFDGDTVDTGACLMARFRDPSGNALMLHHHYAPRAGAQGA
jgi:predicted dinucleotide-binding enzyme/catechol 2,3-dioxygenase-like lactoylglutathione lyase family enzyme